MCVQFVKKQPPRLVRLLHRFRSINRDGVKGPGDGIFWLLLPDAVAILPITKKLNN